MCISMYWLHMQCVYRLYICICFVLFLGFFECLLQFGVSLICVCFSFHVNCFTSSLFSFTGLLVVEEELGGVDTGWSYSKCVYIYVSLSIAIFVDIIAVSLSVCVFVVVLRKQKNMFLIFSNNNRSTQLSAKLRTFQLIQNQ